MATMKDIARIAGVSHGTVSNVLNGRINVSAEKIKLVLKVAEELGYSINAQAKQLRSSSLLSSNIAVIIPSITESKYAILYTGIKKYLEEYNYNVLLFVTNNSPYTEKSIINIVATIRAAGVISITCSPASPEIYHPISKIGGQIVFVEREPLSEDNYIGFDFYQAGLEVANKMNNNAYENIGLMTGLEFFTNEKDFHQGFMDKIENSIQVRVVKTDIVSSVKSTFDFFVDNNIPDAIVTTSINLAESVEFSCSIGINGKQPHIISLAPSVFLKSTHNITKYCLDYTKLGYESAMLLTKLLNTNHRKNHMKVDSKKVCRIILNSKGFTQYDTIFPLVKKKMINVLMIRGQGTNALINMTPSFSKKTNIDVNYVVLPPAEMFRNLLSIKDNEFFDVMRSNMAITRLLPTEELYPINNTIYNNITKGMITKVTKILSHSKNDINYSVPFDASTQLLAYRKDLFTDPMIKRIYYEIYNKPLKVPKDFLEFNEVAAFFTKTNNSDSPVEWGTSMPLGTNSAVFLSFLLRYRSFGGHVEYEEKNKIILDFHKVAEAIANNKESLAYSLKNEKTDWWDANVNNFINGKTSMEIISLNYASNILELKSSKIDGRIGYTLIPGKCPNLGGGSMVIPRKSKNYDEAVLFIEWACSHNQAELFTFLGGLSPHKHVYENNEILQMYPMYDLLLESIEMYTKYEPLDIINRYELENLFGYVLRSIYNGVITIDNGIEILKKKLIPDLEPQPFTVQD